MWCRSTRAIFGHNYYYLVPYYMWLVHSSSCLYTWRARCVFWLEWPSTHQCTIQKIPFWDFMDKMKLSPRGQFTWSVYVFFLCSFFPLAQYFFLGTVFLSLFFWPTPDPKFFLGSSYLPQPTYLPHPADYLPTHLLLRSLPSPKLPT